MLPLTSASKTQTKLRSPGKKQNPLLSLPCGTRFVQQQQLLLLNETTHHVRELAHPSCSSPAAPWPCRKSCFCVTRPSLNPLTLAASLNIQETKMLVRKRGRPPTPHCKADQNAVGVPSRSPSGCFRSHALPTPATPQGRKRTPFPTL